MWLRRVLRHYCTSLYLVPLRSSVLGDVWDQNNLTVTPRHQSHRTEQATRLIFRNDQQQLSLRIPHRMPSLWWRTHLRGPELHQHSLFLRVVIGPLLLQELPVAMKPRARPVVLGQTRWSQELPQSLLNPVGGPLLVCHIQINITERVSHRAKLE